MLEVAGLTTAMLVALGENEVKTLDDFAGCATDDLVGYTEGRGAEAVRHAGFLDGFDVSRADAESMIMDARVRAGWIEAPTEETETVDAEEGAAEELSDAAETAADDTVLQAGEKRGKRTGGGGPVRACPVVLKNDRHRRREGRTACPAS